jgi:hypothetical protein
MAEDKTGLVSDAGLPIAALCAAASLMNEAEINYMIIGRVAAAVWGIP